MKKDVIIEAKTKLDNIISHTNNLTLTEWINEDIQYNIKDALLQFVEFVRNSKLDDEIDDLKDFDCILNYCIDGKNRDDDFVLLVLQKLLPIIKKSISAQS